MDEPRPLAADEVLIDVRGAEVGNWDNIIRSGGWDVGTRPLALGVEAAGVIKAVGVHPSGFSVDLLFQCQPPQRRPSLRQWRTRSNRLQRSDVATTRKGVGKGLHQRRRQRRPQGVLLRR